MIGIWAKNKCHFGEWHLGEHDIRNQILQNVFSQIAIKRLSQFMK
jgi:hypothetical protein